MPDFTSLKGVTSLGDSLLSDSLEANLCSFFDWGLLQAGGYFNVTFPSAGTRLRPVSDPAFDDGRVWEAYRRNWVWESGVPGGGPLAVSGVWVNGSFRPAGSGHHLDYRLGRVVFDAPVTGSVSMEYAFRRVALCGADEEWFQQLQFHTLDFASEQGQFLLQGSGAWNVLAQNRVQLPAVVVEAVSNVRMKPFQIGNGSRVHLQEVRLHVLAETPFDRKQLHDVIVNQWDHTIYLFDKAGVDDADAWPLDSSGTPRPGALGYAGLVAPTGEGGYRWKPCRVANVLSEPHESLPPLYRATCRLTVEVDVP